MIPVTQIYGRKASDGEINWITAIAMAAFHIGSVAALFFFDWGAFATMIVLWWVAGSLGIGMGYHRLLTHRGYKTPKWVEYFLTVCGTLALFEQRQDQQFSAAAFHLPLEHRGAHILSTTISWPLLIAKLALSATTEVLQSCRKSPDSVASDMIPVTEIYGRKASDGQLNTITAVAMGVFHVLAIAALFFINWGAIATAIVLWWVAGSLGIGMGYHRLLTHRGYKTPKWME